MPYLETGWNCSVSKTPVVSLQHSLVNEKVFFLFTGVFACLFEC